MYLYSQHITLNYIIIIDIFTIITQNHTYHRTILDSIIWIHALDIGYTRGVHL